MADVTHARRVADEHAVRLAEYYKSEPLLQGLPVPRIRLPEVVINMPVLLSGHVEGMSQELAESIDLVKPISEQTIFILTRAGVQLPTTFEQRYREELKTHLQAECVSMDSAGGVSVCHRSWITAQRVFRETADEVGLEIPVETMQRVEKKIEATVMVHAVTKPAVASATSVDVETVSVQASGESGMVARIRVVLREEGLEWHHIENEDGTRVSGLTPE